jgi:hypothetical protein
MLPLILLAPLFSRGPATGRGGVSANDLRALANTIKLAHPIHAAGSIAGWPEGLRQQVDAAPHNAGIRGAYWENALWLAAGPHPGPRHGAVHRAARGSALGPVGPAGAPRGHDAGSALRS